MKKLIISAIALLVGTMLLNATQWHHKSLSELLADADLVVVGKFTSKEGRLSPPENSMQPSLAYVWKSNLKVTRILKGSTTEKAALVLWDEIRLGGVPDYQPGEERIWILKKTAEGTAYSTDGRPDTVLSLKELPAVEMELHKKTIEPGGTANRGQSVLPKPNQTPAATGSGR